MIGDILSPTHLLFVLVVALLVLGPKRLPEAGRALGRGIRDFRSAISGEDDHHSAISSGTTAAPAQSASTPATDPTAPAQTATPAATDPTSAAHQSTSATDEPAEQPSEIAHPMG